MVNGSSSVMSQEIITSAAWERIARLGALAWFDRVDSKSNPVDGLSRKNFSGIWQWRRVYFPPDVLHRLRTAPRRAS